MSAQSPRPSSVVGILRAELQRNVDVLKDQPVPAYFAAYTLHDSRSTQIIASFGAVDRSEENRQRYATVEVRVGDYQLDNTHPIRGDARANSPRLVQVSLPLTDDEKPIRLALWRATDRSYKQASEALTRVRTNVAAKVQDENPSADFSREERQEHAGSPAAYTLDTRAWEARLRRVSAVFSEDPLVLRSQVSLAVEADNRYYVNSEGSQIVTGDVGGRIFIQGVTKAEDGMELPLYTSYFATSPDGLPDERQLIADARAMLGLLARLRGAPVVDPFSGPAILTGRAAGVFFHEIFGHRVEGNRQRNADDGQTFTSRVGQPVLPAFLSVAFDPTIKRVGNVELMGHYVYDDQGVRGQRVTVVDAGVLKTFLLDRAPLKNFEVERPRPRGARVPGRVASIEPAGRVVEDRLARAADGTTARRGVPAGQAVRTAVRQHRGRLYDDRTRLGKRVQRPAERGLPHLHRSPARARARAWRRSHRHAPRGIRQDHRHRRSNRRLQRRVRRRERWRTCVGVVAGAAGQRGRSPEEDAVAGNAPDSAGAADARRKDMTRGLWAMGDGRWSHGWSVVEPPRATHRWHRASALSLVALCLLVSRPAAQESPTLLAMQDEMKRSMAELRMKGEAAPYYIAYEVLDRTMSDMSARLGAIVENPPRRSRTLRVEVRVGDYTFDSSRFVVQDSVVAVAA
jgi:predicted Zn-dependent protease